ncbi:MAG: CoA transferase, partial [Pedobacter sp.]
IKEETTAYWTNLLNSHRIWCSDVLNYQQFFESEAYKVLQFDQELDLPNGEVLRGTRSPIRIDNERLFSRKAAPRTGADTEQILKEFNLI